jgi:hypothetical protein
MKKLPINMGDLELALENNAGGIGLQLNTSWFDTETGVVVFLTEDLEEQDETREEIQENSANRYVPIKPIDSHEGFQFMADFVETLAASRLRDKLERSLSSPKPFRHFKDAIYENKGVQERWYKFQRKAVQRYVIEWLADLGIEPLTGPQVEPDIQNEREPANDMVEPDDEELEARVPNSAALVEPPRKPTRNRPSGRVAVKRSQGVRRENKDIQGRGREAGLEFVARELRLHHPDGRFDDGGRFYPSQKEWRDCCAGIRTPSRAFPFSLMTHCRTAKHIAKLYDVSEKDLRAAAASVREQLWYLCLIRDFDKIRSIIENPVLTVDPFLTSPNAQSARAILTETRAHGILKRQVWDSLFATLDDYEKRWQSFVTGSQTSG